MKKIFLVMFCLALISLVSGCAEIERSGPADILNNPLGTDPITTGMTKERVLDLWGRPDVVTRTGTSELGAPLEEWVYRARYPALPIGAGYLHKTKYLYFEGNVLIRWKD